MPGVDCNAGVGSIGAANDVPCGGEVWDARPGQELQVDEHAVFGRAVIKKAAAHGWRYAVVGGEDEGMLLYVRRTEFLEPEEAAADWNKGKLDAIVVPDDEIDGLLPRLQGGEPKKILISNPAGRYRKRYLLLARPPSS